METQNLRASTHLVRHLSYNVNMAVACYYEVGEIEGAITLIEESADYLEPIKLGIEEADSAAVKEQGEKQLVKFLVNLAEYQLQDSLLADEGREHLREAVTLYERVHGSGAPPEWKQLLESDPSP